MKTNIKYLTLSKNSLNYNLFLLFYLKQRFSIYGCLHQQFIFASMLNSDCILCLDTTIIINFPVCSSILTVIKTRWWIMLDVVSGWVGGRERKEKTDVCQIPCWIHSSAEQVLGPIYLPYHILLLFMLILGSSAGAL